MALNPNHVVLDQEFIRCKICNKKVEIIDGKHFRWHNIEIDKITFDEYQKRYPNEPTITKNKYEKEIDRYDKVSKINKSGRTKEVKCFFCPILLEVDSNASTNESVCKECYNKGLRSPSMIQRKEHVEESLAKNHNGITNPALIEGMGKIISQRKKEKFQDVEYKNSVNKKRENTLNDSIGVPNAMFDDELKEKSITNRMNNYDSEKTLQIIRENKLKNHGNPMYINIKAIHEIKRKNIIKKIKPQLEKIGLEIISEYYNAKTPALFRCLNPNCGFVFSKKWSRIQEGFMCPNCIPRYVEGPSKPEIEIREFIESLGEIIQPGNNRSIIYPYELDIVIHSKKLAIEHNGVYHHNEKVLTETRKINGKVYHLFKLNECNKKGYRLISIFGDDWQYKKEICRSNLKRILEIPLNNNINSNDCTIREIDNESKNIFLKENSLYQIDNTTLNIGAFYKNELVSVITFIKELKRGRQEYIWNISRSCILKDTSIQGIENKILTYFKSNRIWNELYVEVDRCWNNGDIYLNLGFKYHNTIAPRHWYVHKSRPFRVHPNDLKKESDPYDAIEWILRKEEGYEKIWDCGYFKFILVP
jgi:hypothetical protein